MNKNTKLQEQLLCWFRSNKRVLPWRKTYNPYHVWVSEIMLQQTQMERGIQYFTKWIQRFPTLDSVAEATEQEILKYWEGLGYYSRARNLHRAAGILKNQYGSEIPCDIVSLLDLPGVGPYTAAAISSIACNKDVSLVDANVARIYSRIFDIDKQVKSGPGRKAIDKISQELIVPGQMRFYNQALMDLGGLICIPGNPRCSKCPISFHCLAFERGTISQRPVSTKKKKNVSIRMATGLLVHRGRIFIQQRQVGDIWAGLWEFPGGQMENGEHPEQTVVREYLEETRLRVRVTGEITIVTHSYMHYRVTLYCYYCELERESEPVLTAADRYRWIGMAELREFAYPAGHRKLLEYIETNEQDRLVDICSTSLQG
nr:A/G-specific adenine glycosylase [Desulfopila sp. IMCC35008]